MTLSKNPKVRKKQVAAMNIADYNKEEKMMRQYKKLKASGHTEDEAWDIVSHCNR